MARARFRIEVGTAACLAVLAVVTVFWHEWIEAIFGVDPDHGSGELEWLVVVVLAVVSLGLSLVARVEWRRLRMSS